MSKTSDLIQKYQAKWVDFRYTDLNGRQQHMTYPAEQALDEDLFEEGKVFDGSSIAGFKSIEASDMLLVPDDSSAVMDPFSEEPCVILTCDVVEPATGMPYERCPRSIAKRAESYLRACGIGDDVLIGPEPEFFIFDGVQFKSDMSGSMFKIISEQAAWSSDGEFNGGNLGHRPRAKGGYAPLPPVDYDYDVRVAICNALEDLGQTVEVHHHEVGSAGQNEIGVKFNTLTCKADEVQTFKYAVHNVVAAYGRTATFMPKPLYGDNGSGMHVNLSISKNGSNLFAGDDYAGLSELALYFIGGVIKHAKALNCFTNPTTNSYKRLVPGFEAPVMLAYSASSKARRVEVRFPDPSANPYLAFAAIVMAGLDGINNKIHPGDPLDKNLYDLPPEISKNVPQVCASLGEAITALDKDRDFLLQGNVFSNDFINAYLNLREEQEIKVRTFVHPLEYELYYSL